MDRNYCTIVAFQDPAGSLSARRAWIEIQVPTRFGIPRMVALRKESVDRNINAAPADLHKWVALRKESVDRNQYLSGVLDFAPGRSPQGERG